VSVMVCKAVVLGSAEGRGKGGEGYFLKGVPERYGDLVSTRFMRQRRGMTRDGKARQGRV
jgi:hypothetical protein